MYYSRKSWDVVGYTFNGDICCAPCVSKWYTADDWVVGVDLPAPVFSDQVTDTDVCGVCGEVL